VPCQLVPLAQAVSTYASTSIEGNLPAIDRGEAVAQATAVGNPPQRTKW
jgi:hypothetical protein